VSEPATDTAGRGEPSRRGGGRLLVAVYGVFALAATSRALVQILTRWHEAPLAFSLSALSGLIYCLATLALARRGGGWRRVAITAVSVELIGVLAVGAFSSAAPHDFPRDTVWSGFGRGYLFVPLVLPFIGLWWLLRGSGSPSRREALRSRPRP